MTSYLHSHFALGYRSFRVRNVYQSYTQHRLSLGWWSITWKDDAIDQI